jgi:hypothetical protein
MVVPEILTIEGISTAKRAVRRDGAVIEFDQGAG